MNSYKFKSLSGTIVISGLLLSLCYFLIRFVPGNEGSLNNFEERVFVSEKLNNDDLNEPFSSYSLTKSSVSSSTSIEDSELDGVELLVSAGFDTRIKDEFLSKRLFDKEEFHIDEDVALTLYRRPFSRPAVEWFYAQITGSREIAQAVLENAEKNDIAPSLAFALAYVESRFKTNAVNKNKNKTIDRGLFQLNSSTFPKLSEKEFFDPKVSAKLGMTHLRYCLDVAGNEITALAMYNAGTVRVRNNSTPQHTLNYVAQISQYKKMLDRRFSSEVVAFYSNTIPEKSLAVAK